MDNEVVIHVRADDDTDRGFASAKRKAGKFGKDFLDEVKKSGPLIGKSLSDGLIGGVSDALPQMNPLILSGVAVLAPEIGALMAAAVVGGSGLLGIAGGVALAAKDPRVKSAASDLGDSVMGDLNAKAGVFVKPLLGSIEQVKAGYRKIAPEIGAAFGALSGQVQPLTAKLVSAGQMLIKGWSAAAQASGPVLQALGGLAQNVALHMEGVFETFAADAPAAAKAVDDLSTSLGNLVTVTGQAGHGLLELKSASDQMDSGLSTASDWVSAKSSVLGGAFDGAVKSVMHAINPISGITDSLGFLGDELGKTGPEAADLADKQGALASSTDDAAAAARQQAEATKAQQTAMQSLADEMKAQTDPLFALIKGQRDVSAAQKDYNKALRDHGPRSAQAREALEKLGQAAFDLNGKAITAAGGFNGKLTPAMRTALRNAGLTSSQMKRLERALEDSASAAHDWEGTYKQTYITSFKQFGKPYSQAAIDSGNIGGLASGGIKGAASGMIGGGFTWTGEHGPELLQLPPGTRVHSNPDSMRMAGGGRGQGGQLEVVLTAAETGGSGLMSAILKALRYEVRSQGGNVQQVLGVQGR